MEIGVYVRNINKWPETTKLVAGKIAWVVCGDYGCPKTTNSLKELLEFNEVIRTSNQKLYYVSPKAPEAVIDAEIDKVIRLLEAGISVSINDWGVFQGLKNQIQPEFNLYIGRFLTSSLASLAWADVVLKKEHETAKAYLLQSNFSDQNKIRFLQEHGIRGIEVEAYGCSERSYQRIIGEGIQVVGYVDNTLLSISRACPLARLKEADVANDDCRQLCTDKYTMRPASEKQAAVYPPMELMGNVLYQPRTRDTRLNEYKMIVYYNPENITGE